MPDQGPTREARYSVEELRGMAASAEKGNNTQELAEMLRQAAEDAEVLERLEAWFDARYTYPGKTELRGSIERFRHEIRVEASAARMAEKHAASLVKLACAKEDIRHGR